jgi:hypothetical protein
VDLDNPGAVAAELERRGLRVTRAGDVPDADDLRCVAMAGAGAARVTATDVNRARLADALRGKAYLVLDGEDGKLHSCYLEADYADMAAKAIEGVIIEVPIAVDYRKQSDRG